MFIINPIFYDSNNTAFYFDGASTSVLNALNVNSILVNNSVNIQTFNTRNLIVKSTGAGDAGILGRGSSDQFAFQIYGSGGDYGFLNGAWNNWDIRKTVNGSLFLNDQSTWYISTSEVYMNRVYGITDMRSPIYYDQNDTGYYLDPASSTSLRIAGNIFSDGSFGTNGAGSGGNATSGRVYGPKGGAYSFSGGAITGAIKIRLPFRANDSMWSMKVRIYNYSTNETSEYLLGNYAYSQGGWNSSASFIGGSSVVPRTVRFGNEGGYDCVWIGETSTSWSYPVVSVMDFAGGYSNGSVGNYLGNWDITITQSIGTVGTTITPDIRFSNVTAVSVNAPSGYVSNGNPWGTSNSAFFPNGITTAGGTNWIYGSNTYIGNAPSNGAGHEFFASGSSNSTGDVSAFSSMRAPIFYDRNDTGYYIDPNNDARLRGLVVGYSTGSSTGVFRVAAGHTDTSTRLTAQSLGSGNSPTMQWWVSEPGITWDEGGFGYNVTNDGGSPGGFSRVNTAWGQAYMRMSTNGSWRFYNTNTSGSRVESLYLAPGGQATFGIDVRSPIFYDSDNTGYYLNPSGGSYFAGSLEIANGYVLTNGIGGAMYMTSVSGSFGGYLRTSGHMVLDQMNAGYNVYVLDGNSVGVVKNAGSQSWSAFSDRTIKTIHSTIEDNLSKLESISPIYYSFNNFADDKNRIGLIAQEVQEHFPELVEVEPMTEKLVLDYTGLIPVLLGAIKELKKEIDILKAN